MTDPDCLNRFVMSFCWFVNKTFWCWKQHCKQNDFHEVVWGNFFLKYPPVALLLDKAIEQFTISNWKWWLPDGVNLCDWVIMCKLITDEVGAYFENAKKQNFEIVFFLFRPSCKYFQHKTQRLFDFPWSSSIKSCVCSHWTRAGFGDCWAECKFVCKAKGKCDTSFNSTGKLCRFRCLANFVGLGAWQTLGICSFMRLGPWCRML